MADRNVFGFHAEAIAARWLWGDEYSRQRGGQMDFYDSLTPARKALCRELVDAIKDCDARAPVVLPAGEDGDE
jgi:hypothetical protein